MSSDLMTMLDELAVEVGYADFEALAAVEPGPGDPTPDELRQRIAATGARPFPRQSHDRP